jgi:DNA-directed RNA polymerase specialized sigma24 family protein
MSHDDADPSLDGLARRASEGDRDRYLLADVLGLTDTDGAEILGCTREAFRQRVSRARGV